jgi:hypothetical protein
MELMAECEINLLWQFCREGPCTAEYERQDALESAAFVSKNLATEEEERAKEEAD